MPCFTPASAAKMSCGRGDAERVQGAGHSELGGACLCLTWAGGGGGVRQ